MFRATVAASVMLALAVCLAAEGCDSDTASSVGTAPEDGGANGGAGSGTGGGSFDGPTTCGFDFRGACASCVEASCCSQWEACSRSGDCASLDQCLLGCNGDATCLQACSDAVTMEVVSLYNEGASCLSGNCVAECYGSSDAGLEDGGPDMTFEDASFDVTEEDAGFDTGPAAPLSGCAYSQCPSSITCGSPQGSNGPWALGCVDGAPLLPDQRAPAVCVEAFESGPPGFLSFPQTYTCNSASIVCDWPEGSISCPVMWSVPASGGGTSLNGGCCGFLVSTDTSPKCGITVADESTGLFGCAAPGPGDTAE
jgi:hypothetical protein